MPYVAIIVLNWNGKEDTLACLASLSRLDYPDYEVIIVDNGSSDGSVKAIAERYPQQKVLETGENLGFVGGNNVGLRYARDIGADYVLLLNNDTEVTADLLSCMIEVIDADPAIGAMGPMIYYYDQPDVIWSAGGYVDWGRGNTYMVGVDERDSGDRYVLRDVDYVTGCALLVRMSVLDEVGDLDPRFFAYYEEAELCVRIQRAGYRIVHVPEAKLWHKIPPGDGRATSPTVHYYMTRNRLLFLKAAGAGILPWLYTLLADYARTLSSWTIKPRWRHKRAQRGAMLEAIYDAWRGQWGRRASG
jgi:GT2 family glycosyltransferase